MLGCYDFCAHYEWTFEWLNQQGGEGLVRRYWDEAISQDSQTHAKALIQQGFEGMKKYWGHTLVEEGAAFTTTAGDDYIRIDMHDCPSKGFLIRNGLAQYRDYCDHCMGWVGPMMSEIGFVVDHEHSHLGQCWWEIRKADDPTPPSAPGAIAGEKDVRLGPAWNVPKTLDTYQKSVSPDDKTTTQT